MVQTENSSVSCEVCQNFWNCCLNGFVRFLTFVFDSSKFESSVNGIYEITVVAGGFAKQQSSSTRYVG